MEKTKSDLRNARNMPGSMHRIHKPLKDEENLTHKLVTIAPDGGWAWVILFVSTWDCLCIDGVSLAYSVIQEKVTEELKIGGVQSSMFVSIYNGIVYMLGPFVAAIANRFGFKIINIIGGLMGGVAMTLCYWGKSYAYELTFFSVVTGMGGSLIYMVQMACPGYWFENRRSLAFGVSNSASGLAALIIPPAANMIIHEIHWRWVFILMGFMYFLAFLFGFLIRKPPMVLVEIEPPKASKREQTVSIINLRTGKGKTANEKLRQISQHTNIQMQPGIRRTLSDPSIIIVVDSKWAKFTKCMKCEKCKEDVPIERPMYKSDIFLHSKVDTRQTNLSRADFMLSLHKLTTERDIKQQLDNECVCCPEAIVRPLKEMLSLSLLKNIVYVILLFDTMIYFSAIYVSFLYITRTSIRKGLSETVAVLALQLFGGFIALSRILLGLVFYVFPNTPPHYFTGIYVVSGGLVQMSMSFTTNNVGTCVIGALSGFLIGVWIPMRSVLVVRYVGLDKLTNAMGMLFVFQALGSFYGPPLAEALSNAFNEDYMTYYFAGSMYTLAGVLIFPLEIINNMRKQ